jgi:hypothetical protein
MSDLQVIQRDDATGVISFKVSSKIVTGFDKLIQMVVLGLLNIPGRDILSPEGGSGLPDLIGSNIDPENPSEAFGEISLRISKTETEIINSQLNLDLDSAERLATIEVLAVGQGENIDEVLARIRITNEEGREAEIVV